MPFTITNRRYTGSKAKLATWITQLIGTYCVGSSFCDLFSGTGVITASVLNSFHQIAINDFLYSNNIIYKAFFLQEKFDLVKIANFEKKYAELNKEKLPSNYVSEHFGNKFFSVEDAKIIGHIRQDIEDNKESLNEKEYAILVASLLYSLDKCANTVGHYDAYFKNKTIPNRFVFDLVVPINTEANINIYREDANVLCKKIHADIVYIDPPYNSRQYSRFYHVLENITKWEKPKLYGVALKPEPENMSEYCRNSASTYFEELINNVRCKYLVVSYNNTYNSKSNSSKNKIDLEFIRQTLQKCGSTQIFEKSHPHFNAGKTDFLDHKEVVFITKVGV